MTQLRFVIWLLIAVQLSSCATTSLWNSTSPDYYKRVRADLVSEEEVKKKGLPYFQSKDGTSFYVQKTDGDRVLDYTYRVVGTPFAVVIDAAYVVLVIGTLGLASGLNTFGVGGGGGMAEGDCKNNARCNEK